METKKPANQKRIQGTADAEAFFNSAGIARTTKAFRRNTTLFSQGESSNHVMYILDGEVKIFVGWFTVPGNATYCASKHAALSVTDAVRMALKAQGTQVVGVYAGYIDTEMAAGINQPKTPPQQVAERTIEGIVTGKDHVLADARAEEVFKAVRREPA